MKTKITILCENTASTFSSLIAEHGLSILIEKEDTTLFDTGQGFGILHNLDVLEKKVTTIQRIIISHGHFDHTGGLFKILKAASSGRKIPVFLHTDAFNHKCENNTKNSIQVERNIGIPKERSEYEKAGAEFRFIKGYNNVTESISAISEIKRTQGWKSWDTRLKVKSGEKITDDPFMDDLSLLIETDSGPVVLLGCAHSGIVEILNDLSLQSGHKEFHAVIGGTHLANAPADYVDNSIDILKHYNVKIIAPAHCSGFRIECMFASRFEKEFRLASAGTIFEF